MDRYLACLSSGVPADLAQRDQQTRARLYAQAAGQCRPQRQSAIDAAVKSRASGTSEAEARALAVDIIDTLDPLSSNLRR
jgi:hypothetical protein